MLQSLFIGEIIMEAQLRVIGTIMLRSPEPTVLE
jgi:hypothetical protein